MRTSQISLFESTKSIKRGTEKALREVMDHDLTFKGEKTAYSTHNTHAFAAKFPPQIPRKFIDELTKPGDIVYDPMIGSGTTLVEAILSERHVIGTDIDKLALMISSMKTTPINIFEAKMLLHSIMKKALGFYEKKEKVDTYITSHYSEKAQEFFSYWFLSDTIRELAALIREIKGIDDPVLCNLFKVIFSSIIVTKNGGVSLALDLAHSRPHKVNGKKIRSAFDAFGQKAEKAISSLLTIQNRKTSVKLIRSDVKVLPLANNSVDLIVTSPPYANAIDYMRAHKFSLIWFGEEPDDLSMARKRYIGAELKEEIQPLPSETATRSVVEVGKLDGHKASILAKYFREMYMAISEMYRVLKPGKACIIVVGSSTMKGYDVMTHTGLAELVESAGFKLIDVKAREIDRDRRMMAISNKTTRFGIEARMHEEYVIAAMKRAKRGSEGAR